MAAAPPRWMMPAQFASATRVRGQTHRKDNRPAHRLNPYGQLPVRTTGLPRNPPAARNADLSLAGRGMKP